MGLRFRKSIQIAPGVKLNLNKKSASISVGTKNVHKTFSTTGKTTTSVNLPGGFSYVDTEPINKNKKKKK